MYCYQLLTIINHKKESQMTSKLIEAKIVPGQRYSENGVVIDAGLSWLEITQQPYDISKSTNAYFTYAVCKCYFSSGETYVYPLKVNQIRLRYSGESIFVLFDESIY